MKKTEYELIIKSVSEKQRPRTAGSREIEEGELVLKKETRDRWKHEESWDLRRGRFMMGRLRMS